MVGQSASTGCLPGGGGIAGAVVLLKASRLAAVSDSDAPGASDPIELQPGSRAASSTAADASALLLNFRCRHIVKLHPHSPASRHRPAATIQERARSANCA